MRLSYIESGGGPTVGIVCQRLSEWGGVSACGAFSYESLISKKEWIGPIEAMSGTASSGGFYLWGMPLPLSVLKFEKSASDLPEICIVRVAAAENDEMVLRQAVSGSMACVEMLRRSIRENKPKLTVSQGSYVLFDAANSGAEILSIVQPNSCSDRLLNSQIIVGSGSDYPDVFGESELRISNILPWRTKDESNAWIHIELKTEMIVVTMELSSTDHEMVLHCFFKNKVS